MRTIYVVGTNHAFRTRRAAERYAERPIREQWAHATDLERIGQEWLPSMQRYQDNADIRRQMEGAMRVARTHLDRGYEHFRQRYLAGLYYGSSAHTIREVTLYSRGEEPARGT